ncbi:uncharacterized protein LOC116265036 [Nymphaea colorata]|nr:uncharacterized protein LOC116265036 [Nymphaea colorata]
MNFFNGKLFKKGHKKTEGKDPELNQVPSEVNIIKEESQPAPVINDNDNSGDMEDDDDDFITGEVKRRLKELRKNSFMVEIPEEDGYMEEESSSSEWRDSEAEDSSSCSAFENVYDKYSEKMLFFDKVTAEQMPDAGSPLPAKRTPTSTTKKLASTLRRLSLKKQGFHDDAEQLQAPHDPYQELETAYVAQVCLTWEALHCLYKQAREKIISTECQLHPCYARVAEHFQQFQVLLQRFIENEPFEPGNRPEIYARARVSMPKLLQVPSFQGADQKETSEESDSDSSASFSDLLRLIQDSILIFRQFLKADKKKPASFLNVFGGHSQASGPLHQIKTDLDKKKMKLKELFKKKKGWKRKSWPESPEEIELLLGLIDMRIVSRVLRMGRINEEQLHWCAEKIGKLDFPGGSLQRNASPILFPC